MVSFLKRIKTSPKTSLSEAFMANTSFIWLISFVNRPQMLLTLTFRVSSFVKRIQMLPIKRLRKVFMPNTPLKKGFEFNICKKSIIT